MAKPTGAVARAGSRSNVDGLGRSLPLALVLALAAAPAAEARGHWRWPVDGDVVTGYTYAGRPYRGGQHRGIDIAAPVGEPVRAATAGAVRFAGDVGAAGLTLTIRTADGRFDTTYLHLSRVLVGAGEQVRRGQQVAEAGASGDPGPAEPHLHFGVRAAGTRAGYRDPLAFLGREGAPPAVAGRRLPPWPDPGRAPAPAPVRAPERLVPARARPELGPGAGAESSGRATPTRDPASPLAPRGPDLGLWLAGAAIAAAAAAALAAALPGPRRAASSIARRWATTSPRRSTT